MSSSWRASLAKSPRAVQIQLLTILENDRSLAAREGDTTRIDNINNKIQVVIDVLHEESPSKSPSLPMSMARPMMGLYRGNQENLEMSDPVDPSSPTFVTPAMTRAAGVTNVDTEPQPLRQNELWRAVRSGDRNYLTTIASIDDLHWLGSKLRQNISIIHSKATRTPLCREDQRVLTSSTRYLVLLDIACRDRGYDGRLPSESLDDWQQRTFP